MRRFARILILQVLKGYQLYNTWFWTPKYWRVLSRRPRLTNLPRYDINIFWALQNKLFFHLADELLVVPLLENWNRPLPFWPNGDFFINSVEEHWFIRNGFWLLLTVLKIIAISHMEITISLSRSGLSCSTYRTLRTLYIHYNPENSEVKVRALSDLLRQKPQEKMGKTFKQNFKRSKFEQERKIKKVICHPDHCKVPGYPRLNDIALVRVARSFNIIPPRVTNEYSNSRVGHLKSKFSTINQ